MTGNLDIMGGSFGFAMGGMGGMGGIRKRQLIDRANSPVSLTKYFQS